MADPAWAADLFRRIALPRLPGSAAVAQVETLIAERLTAAGYSVERQPFSSDSRRLVAGAVFGAALLWLSVMLFPLLVLPLASWLVVVVGLAGFGGIALLCYGITEGHLKVPVRRVDAVNLVAVRQTPRFWLVAHSDSKRQGVSLGGRVIAVALAIIGGLGLVGCLIARWFAPLPASVAVPFVLCAAAGGAALSRKPLEDGSPGAVDNASGIVAALVAAQHLAERGRTDVGVLVTGAEELGMEGARAWVRTRGSGAEPFINFDGIDSRGRFNIMTHAGGARQSAEQTASALVRRLETEGFGARVSWLPLGIFVDGAVLAKGGLHGVTVSRGDWRTLAVIHTTRDGVERTDVSGAVLAGEAAGAVAEELLLK